MQVQVTYRDGSKQVFEAERVDVSDGMFWLRDVQYQEISGVAMDVLRCWVTIESVLKEAA
jgi:hypothetical protein